MAFHLSSQDLRIEDNRHLVGQLQNTEGEFVDASIDLDEVLGNEDGQFAWDGENFSESASNVEFSIEGDGETPVLRAELNNVEGDPIEANINLAERISNDDGSFVFS